MPTIDLTPSWKQAANVILLGLQNGNANGIKIAIEELRGMAAIADKYVALLSADKTKINAFHEIKCDSITSDLMSRLHARAVFLNHGLGFMTKVSDLTEIIAGLLRYKDMTAAHEAMSLLAKAKDLTFVYVTYN